jgi:hypothetical protein
MVQFANNIEIKEILFYIHMHKVKFSGKKCGITILSSVQLFGFHLAQLQNLNNKVMHTNELIFQKQPQVLPNSLNLQKTTSNPKQMLHKITHHTTQQNFGTQHIKTQQNIE